MGVTGLPGIRLRAVGETRVYRGRRGSGIPGEPGAVAGRHRPRFPVPNIPDRPDPMDFAAVRRDSLVRYLRRHLAGEVRFDDTSRRLYSTDASHYAITPLGVVIPKNADDLTATVQIASELGVPITARGGGTSLSGQSIGPGIVIDCSKYMNNIGEVDVTGRKVRVQPGIVLDHLNHHLAKYGLLFGPEVATASRATLGGMIGNNSAG